ncbi:hypothetical protein GQ44DRAFT_697585 [Phaeosphaeriaceae sp. PMI808]|nr:hypothetical protein GQ44DRAFT_697585 [Phaeosphaeriaceae sp. PMI808]
MGPTGYMGHSVLIEDTLIWICLLKTHRPTAVYFFNMKTCHLQTFQGDARETVRHLFASDKLVGFATHGTLCYVWDFDHREKRKFRVPNSDLFQSIACRGRMIACAGCLDDYALVYIWNYDNQRGISFTISYETTLFTSPPSKDCAHQHGLALLLQPKDERIVVFADEFCAVHDEHLATQNLLGGPSTISYSQFAFTGRCLSGSKLYMDRSIGTGNHNKLQGQFTPTDRKGRFRIRRGAMSLQFDENDKILTESPYPKLPGSCSWASCKIFWWNDVCFYIGHSEAVLSQVEDGHRKQLKKLITKCTSPSDELEMLDFTDDRKQHCLLLNERYAICAMERSFEVLCFDDSVHMSGDSPLFRDPARLISIVQGTE